MYSRFDRFSEVMRSKAELQGFKGGDMLGYLYQVSLAEAVTNPRRSGFKCDA